jgi:hypothetical protein
VVSAGLPLGRVANRGTTSGNGIAQTSGAARNGRCSSPMTKVTIVQLCHLCQRFVRR